MKLKEIKCDAKHASYEFVDILELFKLTLKLLVQLESKI